MNKTLQELTNEELTQVLLNNVIQKEIVTNQVTVLAQELLKRQQQAQQAVTPLKKIVLPTDPSSAQ